MSQFHHFLTADDRQWYCWSCGGLMGSDGQVGCPGSIGFQVSRNSFFIHFYFCQTKLTTHESSQGPALSICIILIKYFGGRCTYAQLRWSNKKEWKLCYASKSFKEFSTSWFFLITTINAEVIMINATGWVAGLICERKVEMYFQSRYFSIRNNIWSLKQQILIISAEVEGK